MFRGHDDYSIGAADSIDGRRSRILEYADTLDLIRVHRVELGEGLLGSLLDAVDNDQRSGISIGRYAADEDIGSIESRLT